MNKADNGPASLGGRHKNKTAGSVVLYFSGDKCYGQSKAGERGRGQEGAAEILTSMFGRVPLRW